MNRRPSTATPDLDTVPVARRPLVSIHLPADSGTVTAVLESVARRHPESVCEVAVTADGTALIVTDPPDPALLEATPPEECPDCAATLGTWELVQSHRC